MTGVTKWSFHPYKPLLFDTGDIYISDTSFNINWKMIRRSIEYGMELYVQDGGELNIETAKELVDVSRLDKKGYKASIH